MELLKTNLGRLRIVGFLEGMSFIILMGIGMPLKYYFANPVPNRIIGMAHGLLFVLYVLMVFIVKLELKWSIGKMLLAWIASIVPFGTFIADHKLFRDNK